VTSGSQTTTPRIPPSSGILASMSPKVLVTESFPGMTLNGPIKGLSTESFISFLDGSLSIMMLLNLLVGWFYTKTV
jgi:hypothetical protein